MKRFGLVALVLMLMTVPADAATPTPRTIFWANVQGASHTGLSSALSRMRTMAGLVEATHADLGVFSELEASQARAFLADTNGDYALAHPFGDTRNSVFYRKIAYRLMWRRSLVVPYFNGHLWRIPVVRLCDRAQTHRCIRVISVHNTASTHRFPHQGWWRAQDVAIEERYINRHPKAHIILIGDFNEKRPGIATHTRLNRSAGIERIDVAFAVPERVLSPYRRILTTATDHRAVYVARF